ncbi:MAG TPA: 5-oxoprolinase subunit PxpA [Chryseosolibacter sp.]
MTSIDINCDMGESFGAFSIGQDEALMEYVSSVNIACGFHGGDPSVMRKTVHAAARRGLAIGAHPGYPDLQGFGRRDIKFSTDEIYDMVLYQVGALKAFAEAAGTMLYHVKPHGALYNFAAKDAPAAAAIAKAVFDADPRLRFVGLSGSELLLAGQKAGLKTVSEVFADRTYQDDGTLTPRASKGALIENEAEAARQVVDMVLYHKVRALSGKEIPIKPDSVCIHGDGKNALAYARAIVHELKANHVSIARP